MNTWRAIKLTVANVLIQVWEFLLSIHHNILIFTISSIEGLFEVGFVLASLFVTILIISIECGLLGYLTGLFLINYVPFFLFMSDMDKITFAAIGLCILVLALIGLSFIYIFAKWLLGVGRFVVGSYKKHKGSV